MEKENNTEKPLYQFRIGYFSFTGETRREIKSKIIAWTGWGRQTFYNKLQGKIACTQSEEIVLNMIFLDYGVSAQTGMEIEKLSEAI